MRLFVTAASDISFLSAFSILASHKTSRLESLLKYIADHHWGELVNILGILIELAGFGITIAVAVRSKKAAERAEQAVKKMRENLRLSDTIMSVTAAIKIMEEIKRLHRTGDWKVLLDRYATLRGLLIEIKSSNPTMIDDHHAALTGAVQQFSDIEKKVEKAVAADAEHPKVPKLNEIVSFQIDRLSEVLGNIRQEVGREEYVSAKADKASIGVTGKVERR